MVTLVATGESIIAALKLVAVLVFCRAGGPSFFCFWCWPWVWTKLSSLAVCWDITIHFSDDFLGEVDDLPVGVFGDVSVIGFRLL